MNHIFSNTARIEFNIRQVFKEWIGICNLNDVSNSALMETLGIIYKNTSKVKKDYTVITYQGGEFWDKKGIILLNLLIKIEK